MTRDRLLEVVFHFFWVAALVAGDTLLSPLDADSIALTSVIAISLYWVRRHRNAAKQLKALHTNRGVVAVSCGRNRAEEFSQLWEHAQEQILCWGVGMTNIVRDAGLIESAVRRGCTVKFEMIDPIWLRSRPEICALLDATYDRNKLVDQIDEALGRLVDLRDRLNEKYGIDRVQVYAVLHYQGQSGTVADPACPTAFGYIEHHTMGFPNGQARVKAVMYGSPNPDTEPPYLQSVLDSRLLLARWRVGKNPTDREQFGWAVYAERITS
jgi:hypothetical protein